MTEEPAAKSSPHRIRFVTDNLEADRSRSIETDDPKREAPNKLAVDATKSAFDDEILDPHFKSE